MQKIMTLGEFEEYCKDESLGKLTYISSENDADCNCVSTCDVSLYFDSIYAFAHSGIICVKNSMSNSHILMRFVKNIAVDKNNICVTCGKKESGIDDRRLNFIVH